VYNVSVQIFILQCTCSFTIQLLCFMTTLEVLPNIFSISCAYGFVICSDTLVEEEVGGNSVADIFKHHGEPFFRNKEVSLKTPLFTCHSSVSRLQSLLVVLTFRFSYFFNLIEHLHGLLSSYYKLAVVLNCYNWIIKNRLTYVFSP